MILLALREVSVHLTRRSASTLCGRQRTPAGKLRIGFERVIGSGCWHAYVALLTLYIVVTLLLEHVVHRDGLTLGLFVFL